jgi:nuclear transport factor 2 (NTF2) superfamily protein
MHGVTFPRNGDAWSRHQANTLLHMVQEIAERDDFPALIDLFAEDCIFRLGAPAEQKGRVALRQALSGQLLRRQGERLVRSCVAIDGNRLTIRWEGTWTDKETGAQMAGFGLEVWTMRGGKIVQFEATFNAGEQVAAGTPVPA